MLKSINEHKTNIIIGKPLEVDGRVLYPVIQMEILKNNEGTIKGVWSIPIAIVVEEDSDRFVILLIDEDIDLNKIFKNSKNF